MHEWRKENNIDQLFLDVDIDEFEKTRRLVSLIEEKRNVLIGIWVVPSMDGEDG